MTALHPATLRGTRVLLEPLALEHHDGLVAAARDGALWTLWYTSVPTPEGMRREIDRRLALQEGGSMLPFTARRVDPGTGEAGPIIGMTTYMNIDQDTPRVEIGSTWNAASAQRTGANAESKYLLLRHAFEQFGCPAVEFRTHWMNHQSREAIERLGAKQDGVLRSHSRTRDGELRNSVLAHEWPMVRDNLLYRMARHA